MSWLKLALGCCLVLAGCGGGDVAGASASDTAVDGGGMCVDLTRQASDFVATHRSCNVDSDCSGEANYGFIYNMGSEVSCWPAVVISADAVSGFVALMEQLFAAKCTGPSPVCSARVPSAACKQHVCVEASG